MNDATNDNPTNDIPATAPLQSCGRCKYSGFAGIGATHLKCRRFPPSTWPIPQRGQMMFLSEFPSVKSIDVGCGEWKPKIIGG